MAQTCTVIQADPWTLASELSSIGSGVAIVEKTSSAGKFLVVLDSAISGQTFEVITGDPDKLVSDLTALVGAGSVIDLIIPTFSASHYVVAYS
jgi:hypothetical protein